MVISVSTMMSQSSGWTKVGCPGGAEINSMIVNFAGYVVLGAQGGIYLSLDDGTSWQRITSESGNVSSLLQRESGEICAVLNLGGRENYIYRSTDDGFGWKGMRITSYPRISALAFGDSGYMYVGTTNAGIYVYHSGDGGETRSWIQVGLDAQFHSLMVTDSGHILAGTDLGIFRSTNHGVTFRKSHRDSLNVSSIIYDKRGTYYAASHKGILRSVDHGRRWTIIDSTIRNIRALTFDRNLNLLAGTDSLGLYRWNHVVGWTKLQTMEFPFSVNAICVTGTGSILLGTRIGIVKVKEQSQGMVIASWCNEGLAPITVHSIASFGERNYYAATSLGVYCSDNLSRWLPMAFVGKSVEWVDIDETGDFYAKSWSELYISKDSGTSWRKLNVSGSSYFWIIHQSMFASSYRSFLRSNDGGVSWERLVLAEGDTAPHWIASNSRGMLFALSSWNQKLYCSTDMGTTWTHEARFGSWNRISINSEGVMFALDRERRLHVSETNGETWQRRDSTPAVSYATGLFTRGSAEVFLSTWRDIYHSTDNGLTWEDDFMDTGRGDLSFFQSSDHDVFVFSPGGGLYRHRQEIVGVGEEVTVHSASVSSAYPNPFNQSTTIDLILKDRSLVSFFVFNTLGQRVMTSGQLEYNPGAHTLRWDAGNLPSGMYYHVMDIVPVGGAGGRQILSGKIILMK